MDTAQLIVAVAQLALVAATFGCLTYLSVETIRAQHSVLREMRSVLTKINSKMDALDGLSGPVRHPTTGTSVVCHDPVAIGSDRR